MVVTIITILWAKSNSHSLTHTLDAMVSYGALYRYCLASEIQWHLLRLCITDDTPLNQIVSQHLT